MNRCLITSLLMASVMATSSPGQDDKDMDQMLLEMGKDAAPGYLSPFMNTLGTGMNNGWYNSSKSYSFLGLPLGVSIGTFALTIGQITNEMKTFDFEGDVPLRALIPDNALPVIPGMTPDEVRAEIPVTLPVKKNGAATIYGSREPDSLTWGELLAGDSTAYDLILKGHGPVDPMADSTEKIFPLPFRGLIPGEWWGSLPNITALTVGFKKLPVIDNIQLGLSYVPPVSGEVEGVGSLDFNMLSYKIQHEVTPLIPGLDKLKILHLSWYWAQSGLELEAGDATLEMNNWLAMVNGSLDFKFLFIGLGAFAGIGYESSSMSFDVKAGNGLSGFSAEVPAERTMKYQLGARGSLFIFDVWGEYNMGQVNSLTLGLTAVAFNGL